MSGPPMRFGALLASTGGAHAAEQLALASLPLTAALMLGAGPGAIGGLIAVHGMAALVMTLPAGLMVDRWRRKAILVASQALAAAALLAGALAASERSISVLAIAAFVAASGTVVHMLAMSAMVPSIVGSTPLPKANGRIEVLRALAALAAPAVVGVVALHATPVLGFALAACAACVGACAGATLPATPFVRRQAACASAFEAIVEGARFTFGQPLLRGIVLCATFWNFAFFAMLAAFVPYALGGLGLDASGVGIAQSGYGAGLLAGALAAPLLLAQLPPNVILIAGPAVSVLAAMLLLAAAHGAALTMATAAHFALGFAPMLWLICQTSLRQLITPAVLLGRVGATIQVAIYGVRPLGALAGGALAALHGPRAAIAMSGGMFALSLLAALSSELARLRSMPAQVAPLA